jgi:hypothetical protein
VIGKELPDRPGELRSLVRALVARCPEQRYGDRASARLLAVGAVTVTVPFAWHAKVSAIVRRVRSNAAPAPLSSPGPLAPAGIAAGVPGATKPGAVPGAAGRSPPLPGRRAGWIGRGLGAGHGRLRAEEDDGQHAEQSTSGHEQPPWPSRSSRYGGRVVQGSGSVPLVA